MRTAAFLNPSRTLGYVPILSQIPKVRYMVVTQFERLVGGLLLRRFGFNPRPVLVGFMVNQIALGQILSEYFGFPMSLSFHQYSTHFFYLSVTVILSIYMCYRYIYLYIQLLIPVLVFHNSPVSGLGLLCIACLDLSTPGAN